MPPSGNSVSRALPPGGGLGGFAPQISPLPVPCPQGGSGGLRPPGISVNYPCLASAAAVPCPRALPPIFFFFVRFFFVRIFSSEFFRRNFFVGIFLSEFFRLNFFRPSSVRRPSVRPSSVRPSSVRGPSVVVRPSAGSLLQGHSLQVVSFRCFSDVFGYVQDLQVHVRICLDAFRCLLSQS